MIPGSILRLLLVDNAYTPHYGRPILLVNAGDTVRMDLSVYEHETSKIIEGV